MQDWNKYKLVELATLQRGFDLPNTKRIEGKHPVMAASGFSTWHNEFKVKGPGVITGRSGTLGQVHFVNQDFWPLNTTLWVKDFHANDEKFIYYLLKTLSLEDYNTGTSVPTLNRNDVHRLEIHVPEYKEQKSISSILSTLDDKIVLNLQMNKTLEEMAMALYKHWLVDFGPFQNGKFVESELGMIPEGWEVKSILEIVDLLSGGTPKTIVQEYWNGDINWVSAKDIGNGGLIYINETEKTITQAGVNNSSTKILPEDTVILVARGSVGKYGMIAKPMAMNQSCYGLFTKGDFSQGLVYLMFSRLIEQFKRVAYGSVFDTITTSTFITTNVIIPPKEVVNNLKDLIDPIFIQLKQNTLENQTLTTLRDTLLPKLISGEVRVKDIEQMVAAAL